MREISLDEVKEIGLSTLIYFSDFCRQHDLRYYLAYGTLIGAVRHKGFIPWDDDIDVWMPRKDYDRLLDLHAEIEVFPYKLNAPEINPYYLSPFAKLSRDDTVIEPSRYITGYLYGSSIDIFALDYFLSDKDIDSANQEYRDARLVKQMRLNAYHAYTDGKAESLAKHLSKKILFKLSTLKYGKMSKRIVDYSRWLSCNDGSSVNGFLTTVAGSYLYEPIWFKEIIELEFEGMMFPAPKGFDAVLKRRYGNYLEFPPESEQCVPHHFSAHFKE